jgi:hypothetical protein
MPEERFNWKDFSDFLQTHPEVIAEAIMLGVAKALIATGATDKRHLKNNPPQPLIGSFSKVLRATISLRAYFRQELYKLYRIGSVPYFDAKLQSFSKVTK